NAGPGHSMVFAGPGSHKSVSAVTRLWHWPGPLVVFDPSCELGPVMTKALRKQGRNVVTIGAATAVNDETGETGETEIFGLNVLDWIDIRHRESDAHVRTAVDWIYNEGTAHRENGGHAKDPFWGTWGRALVTCLAAHMLTHPNPKAPKTLASLRRGIATPENEMQALLAGIHQSSA